MPSFDTSMAARTSPGALGPELGPGSAGRFRTRVTSGQARAVKTSISRTLYLAIAATTSYEAWVFLAPSMRPSWLGGAAYSTAAASPDSDTDMFPTASAGWEPRRPEALGSASCDELGDWRCLESTEYVTFGPHDGKLAIEHHHDEVNKNPWHC